MNGQTTLTAEQAKKACERIMSFTPGPWQVMDDVPTDEKWSIKIVASEFHNSGGGEHWICDVHQQFTSRENGFATARLIAAAPSMLAALKSVIAWKDNPELFPAALIAVQNAIDLATK